MTKLCCCMNISGFMIYAIKKSPLVLFEAPVLMWFTRLCYDGLCNPRIMRPLPCMSGWGRHLNKTVVFLAIFKRMGTAILLLPRGGLPGSINPILGPVSSLLFSVSLNIGLAFSPTAGAPLKSCHRATLRPWSAGWS